MDAIEANKGITVDELAEKIGKHRTTILRAISRLKEKRILDREGSNKNGNWIILKDK